MESDLDKMVESRDGSFWVTSRMAMLYHVYFGRCSVKFSRQTPVETWTGGTSYRKAWYLSKPK